MRIDIITVLPELIEGFLNESIIGRAQKNGLVEIHIHNLRDYTTNKHKKVDDYPFGGFAGMVMQCQPIDACISKLKSEREYDEAWEKIAAESGGKRNIYEEVLLEFRGDFTMVHDPESGDLSLTASSVKNPDGSVSGSIHSVSATPLPPDASWKPTTLDRCL